MDTMAAGVIAKALESHIAILGKTGSGKSNTGKWMAEELMDRGERFCAVDPTGTWWGMRLTRSGKASKYKPVIFGGEHADIPILPEHGAAVAETVASSTDSCIIDLRGMSVGGRTKFMTAFAETLLQKNRGPLHLILDEAHLFAPQGRVNDPQAGAMLSATNNLVSLGRGNGIRIVMISQRPAKLHKDSLTQCETLIAMRLIAPQDRSAIYDWVGEWGDVGKGKEIVASLPSLPRGQGWVWAPEQDHLDLIAFPLVKTLDTGKPDAEGRTMVTLKIDVGQITARLEAIGAEVIANDPKRLKSRIAELERDLGRAKAAPAGASAQELDDARNDGFTAGWEAGTKAGYSTGAMEKGKELGQMFLNFSADFAMAANVKTPVDAKTFVRDFNDAAAKTKIIVKARSVGKTEVMMDQVIQRQAAGMAVSNITGPQAKILTALKVWQVLGHQEVTKPMLAALAGYSPTSGGFGNLLGQLRAAARIDYPSAGKIQLLIDWDSMSIDGAWALFRDNLSAPHRKILNALYGHGEVTKAALAEATGYSPTSGGYGNLLGQLRTLGMIDYPGKGVIAMTTWTAELMEKQGSL